MRFKVDENLPNEIRDLLIAEGHFAETVRDEDLSGCDDTTIIQMAVSEGAAVVTLDLDFSNILNYPPEDYRGILVMRVRQQDKQHVINVFRYVLPLLSTEVLTGTLWIIDEDRIRIRS